METENKNKFPLGTNFPGTGYILPLKHGLK